MSEIIYQSGVSVGLISSVIYAVINPVVWPQSNTDLGPESAQIFTQSVLFDTF